MARYQVLTATQPPGKITFFQSSQYVLKYVFELYLYLYLYVFVFEFLQWTDIKCQVQESRLEERML